MATKNAYSQCKSAVVLLILLLLPISGFADLTNRGDGTVYDDAANLLWQISLRGEKNWADATTEAAAATELVFTDWRLPTLTELRTLVDSTYQPQINPMFNPGRHPRDWTIWTSTIR